MFVRFPNSKLILRAVPETSRTRYIGGYSALNLPMPETSGGRHQPDFLYCPEDRPCDLIIFGDNVEGGIDHISTA